MSFTLHRGTTPVLVSMPHVGTVIPQSLRHRFVERAGQTEDTDWFLDRLYAFVKDLGASLIGRPCERALWMTFRWVEAKKFSGRMLRLFKRGQREEAEFIEELRGIGATVWDKDENGKQWTVSACNGHFGGSLDGVATGLPEAPKTVAVLEFKTHSSKSFADLVKNAMTDMTQQSRAAETQMTRSVQGQGNLIDVVTALSSAEASLETVISVRDQVISAYKEIMAMPI